MDEKSVRQAFQTINDMLIDRGTIKEEDRKEISNVDQTKKSIFHETITYENQKKYIYVIFYLHNKFSKTSMDPYLEPSPNSSEYKSIPGQKSNEHVIFVYKDKFTTVNEKNLKNQIQFKKIELFCIKNILFNITKHELVPKHELVGSEEAKEIYNRYSIKDNQKILKLPLLITKTDPVSKYYDFKPTNLIKITRPSSSVGESVSYRYCV